MNMNSLKLKQWFMVVFIGVLLGLVACGGANEGMSATPVPTTVPASAVLMAVATAVPEMATNTPGAVVAASAALDTGAASTAVANTKLNLNAASGDDFLNTIPNFGNRMVREFQEYRPYVSILQFRREIGKYVDEAQVAFYEQYVYVPVNVDEADAATLQQIPGVDATIAEALIAARPYGSNDAFLAKLGEYLAAEQVAVAAGYLETP